MADETVSEVETPAETPVTTDAAPDPMRVSAGFCVIGLSGKIRIHTLPPRRM